MQKLTALCQSASYKTRTAKLWLKELTCGKASHDCIKCCSDFVVPDSSISCASGVYVQVECTFDVSRKAVSAGSQTVCSVGCPNSCSSPVVVMTVLLLFFIAVAMLILLCICCLVPSCYLFKWRKGKFAGYSSNF